MRLSVVVTADIAKILRNDGRAVRRAETRALRIAAPKVTTSVKSATQSSMNGRKLAQRWRSRVVARSGRAPFAIISPRGLTANQILHAHSTGVTVRAKGGRYLAIPTLFNRKLGRRGGSTAQLFRTGQKSGWFVQRSRKGNLIVFAKVSAATKVGPVGRRYQRAVVNGVDSGGKALAHLLGSGRRGRQGRFLQAGIVPMFVLLKQVRINKRLDLDRETEKAATVLTEALGGALASVGI